MSNKISGTKISCSIRFYPIIDSILIELNDRFSSENMEILKGISALCPDSGNFLQVKTIKTFAMQMKADFCSLCDEIQVLKSMLKDSKLESIIDLYLEILAQVEQYGMYTAVKC